MDTANPADAASTRSAGSAPALEEILVTSQRRKESVQKTALAVTALSGDTLEQSGVGTVQGLQSQVPGLNIAPQVFGNLQVFLRGVGSTNNSQSGDPAIAVNVDDAYVSRTTSIGGLFFDINRVEVVKGPQGTLYGRNATGGAINIITNKPNYDFGGDGYVEVGNYGQLVTGGAVNVPLANNLAVRAAYESARHDPYMQATNGGSGTQGNSRQDQDDVAARIHLLYEPTAALSILLTADMSHQGGSGADDNRLPSVTGDPYVILARQTVMQDNKFTDSQAEVNYDFGFAKLTYIIADRDSSIDRDYEYPVTNLPGVNIAHDQTLSNELRLGAVSGPLTWVIGAYQFHEFQRVDLTIGTSTGTYIDYPTPFYSTNSGAGFGQATLAVTDRFRLTGGLRYTGDGKRQLSQTNSESATHAYVKTLSTANFSGHWSDTTWKGGAEYDVAGDSLLYANVGTAYKAGGFSSNVYNPEHLTSYELGLKNQFFDRRVILNLAAFYYDYTNLQVSGVTVVNGVATSLTYNAATARIKGLELETNYRATQSDRLDASLAYTDARYGSFVLPYGDSFTNYYLAPGTTAAANFSGESMPLVPKLSVTAGYEHTWDFARGELVGRVQSHYETGRYMDFHDFSDTHQNAYTKTDLSLAYSPSAKRWTLAAYVRNIENKAVLTSAIPPVSGSPATAQVEYAAPRLYGARLTVTF